MLLAQLNSPLNAAGNAMAVETTERAPGSWTIVPVAIGLVAVKICNADANRICLVLENSGVKKIFRGPSAAVTKLTGIGLSPDAERVLGPSEGSTLEWWGICAQVGGDLRVGLFVL